LKDELPRISQKLGRSASDWLKFGVVKAGTIKFEDWQDHWFVG